MTDIALFVGQLVFALILMIVLVPIAFVVGIFTLGCIVNCVHRIGSWHHG